jgi:hypothetical protein
MAYPAPPPPPGGYGCPRCGSPHLTEAETDARFFLLSLLNQTTCNGCGFSFNGKTGKGISATIALWIAIPVLVAFGLTWVLIWLLTYER